MEKYRRGEAAPFPFQVRVHLVAARYGTTPELVRAWPADDFLMACQLLGVTG